MAKKTIVFIHGLWMHSSTWEPWMKFFSENGYETMNPSWPGDGDTVEASRANPKAIANYGVTAVADSYAKKISSLQEQAILIGHSFGGLLVQILLGRGVAAAAIAIDPAPMKGVWQLPFSALRAAFPVLGNPLNLTKSVSLTYNQFRYAFANMLTEQEAKELYDRCTVPSPGRPLFQVATATFNPNSETRVNISNSTRGPLLITSGEKDHIVPPVLSKAAFKKYSKSPAITELKSFEGRGHSLTIDHGWKEVAEYSLSWLKKNGM
ncbi:MAG TPA: alpha/beta hydrolase [Chitinophagales bacterium]|nr:alpha/beta hydrolase [Chitinophagales bacterium]